jgi:hypothetical protein
VIGAGAIVLAAMYMLRAISAVLHQDVGPAVPDSALDLRPGELAVVVPLVLCLIGLSAYPNLISGHAFGGNLAVVPSSRATTAATAFSCAAGSCQVVLKRETRATTFNIDQSVHWVRYAP